MIKDLHKLAGLKEVELLSIRPHPHKSNENIVVNVGMIKDYDYVTYDNDEKAILFLRKAIDGMLVIVDRIQKESFIKIYADKDEVKIFVD